MRSICSRTRLADPNITAPLVSAPPVWSLGERRQGSLCRDKAIALYIGSAARVNGLPYTRRRLVSTARSVFSDPFCWFCAISYY